SVLGRGGFAIVYRAHHRLIGRAAALKVLSSEMSASDEMVKRFIREAKIVNLIHSPNIVDIYEFGEMPNGRPYCVMELLIGRDLQQILDEKGRLPLEEVISYVKPVCAALEAAHQEGIVHRDVKASNIMVCGAEGSNTTVKLLDFGIAKLVYPEPGETG